ncbi:hypothetical protein INT47_012510 [Mucor saturninus]|uniref:Uncharacterized protein n=1 Tax=Mucor saturninus TaxID=64648 RepID=A0A8H7QRB4_9FUNG|nr:hypothetical protein INT47_012510 [Mucor saturninus]
MSSRPLSVLIPSSWSQQKKRTPSIQSSSSSNAVHSPSWSTMSIDQLSLYARRASNSSLSMLAGNVEDKKKIRQAEKLQQGIHGYICISERKSYLQP